MQMLEILVVKINVCIYGWVIYVDSVSEEQGKLSYVCLIELVEGFVTAVIERKENEQQILNKSVPV